MEKRIRLFENPLMEGLTHVHPMFPMVLWTPILVYIFSHYFAWNKLSVALCGLLVWTLTEYVFHRFFFHFKAKSRLGKRLVYLFHGIHHDDPDDATRLVMPPIPSLLLAFAMYGIFYLFLGKELTPLFFAFFIVGYLLYDYTHYFIHHIPLKFGWFKTLRKNHLYHHTHEEEVFGVSSQLWDVIFGTQRKSTKS